MKLKTFKASTMPQALAQVKREIGPDAVIVNTRTYTRGGIFGLRSRTIVEVTAREGKKENLSPAPGRNQNAERLRRLYSVSETQKPLSGLNRIPENPITPPSFKKSVPDTIRADNEIKKEINKIHGLVENLVKEQRQLHAPQMPEQLFDLYLDLIQKEVADEIAREMIARVQQEMTGNQLLNAHLVQKRFIDVIDNMISATGPIQLNPDNSARVVALIGPTGVGKTTTIAKLAANLKLRQNKKVGLITIDTYRIGAVDQLRMYAQIIDVPLKVVLTPGELKEAVAVLSDMDVILIDTAGRSQNDELKIQELKTFLDAAAPHEIHLVLSGTSHHTNMLSAAERFKPLGVDRLILTKLDEAIGFGVVLSVMRKVNTSLSYITTGQDVPDDIEVGNGRKLAQMLLGFDEKKMQADTFAGLQA
jgi:flagellar biosynthesis protein FlhF